MKDVDISVLVVSYNHENYIEGALASIASQLSSYTVEVVIADDASTDGTLKLIHAWQQSSGMNVRVLESKSNLGITQNYERAFRACSGRFIAVLEGDDEWLSVEKIQIQARFLDAHEDVVVVANRVLHLSEESGESTVWPNIGADLFCTPISSERIAEMNWFGTFSTCMFRASALDRVPPELFEEVSYDWMVNMAITAFGDGALLPEVTTLYRVHSAGAWTSQSPIERDLKMRAIIPRYMELLGGRLDRQLSVFLAGVERRLEQTASEQLVDPALTPAPQPTTAPSIRIPRVDSDARPMVSVVMTSSGNTGHIREAIESVLNQTVNDLELIVVDYGSSDSSLELIPLVSDPRVRTYFLREDVGAAAALNIAIQQSRGTYVGVINSNDRWELRKLARQLEIFAEKPDIGAVFTGVGIVNEHGRPLDPSRIPSWIEVFRQPNRSQGQWLRYFMTHGNALCHSTVLIKRSVYEELGLYDSTLQELFDLERWIALVKHCPIEVLGDEPLVQFRTSNAENSDSKVDTGEVVRTYHEHVVVNQRFFAGITTERLDEGFADVLRFRFCRTEMEIECVTAFLWLDCDGPLRDVNSAQALTDLRHLLRDAKSKLYLQTYFGVRDTYIHELATRAEGAHTLGALQALRSFRLTPERQIVDMRSSRGLRVMLTAMRRTPLRQWPIKIRSRLTRGR